MKKITYLMALFIAAQTITFAQTAIPDVNFEQALIDFNIDNSDPGDLIDGIVDDGQAAALMGTLSIANYTNADTSVNLGRITDFTGIEAFTQITGLVLSDNDMASLVLTSNTALTLVNTDGCSNLASIDVTGLTSLSELQAPNCALGPINGITTLTGLTKLYARNNLLAGDLDLTNSTLLTEVDLKTNMLTGLDMRNTNNGNVTFFNASFNNDGIICLFVDDDEAAYLGTLPWIKDGGSTFVDTQGECDLLGTEDRTASVFSMYPNPTRNSVYVAAKLQTSKMDVYSITGKLVLSKALNFGDNNVNVSSLSTGIYLAKFSSDDRSETKKLIIN